MRIISFFSFLLREKKEHFKTILMELLICSTNFQNEKDKINLLFSVRITFCSKL